MLASRTAELEVRSRELERSNTELDQFASVASHDLQEPLRMVAAYSELVARDHGGDLDDEGRELLGFVLDGARRMQQLIDDLLEYSRLRTRSRDHVTVELADVVADAVRDLRLVIDETGADVRVGSLPAVEGDPAQLRMLVQNLLGNALKYRGEGPLSITVDAQAADGCWVVSVADDGIGVPEEQRERIFEPFRRLHARSRYPGTGIGLAICRRIADQHGGRIWVEPAAGGWKHLPGDVAQGHEGVVVTRRRTERPWRLLLVEDNPGDVLLVRRCLAASGVDVELVVIEDGDEAPRTPPSAGEPQRRAPPRRGAAGPGPARPRRAPGAGRHQGRPRPAHHPRVHPDLLRPTRGRHRGLRRPRELLRHQTAGPRRLPAAVADIARSGSTPSSCPGTTP